MRVKSEERVGDSTGCAPGLSSVVPPSEGGHVAAPMPMAASSKEATHATSKADALVITTVEMEAAPLPASMPVHSSGAALESAGQVAETMPVASKVKGEPSAPPFPASSSSSSLSEMPTASVRAGPMKVALTSATSLSGTSTLAAEDDNGKADAEMLDVGSLAAPPSKLMPLYLGAFPEGKSTGSGDGGGRGGRGRGGSRGRGDRATTAKASKSRGKGATAPTATADLAPPPPLPPPPLAPVPVPTADATRKPGKAPKRKGTGPKTVFKAITEAAEWGADHTGQPLSAPCACAAQGSGVCAAQGADVEASKHERVADIFQAEASSSANMSNDGAGGSTNEIAGNLQPAEGAEEETKQELVEDAQVAVAEHQ